MLRLNPTPLGAKPHTLGAAKQLSDFILSELRVSHGSARATKRAILRYFHRGALLGLSLDELITILFLVPTPTTSVFARIGFTRRELEAIMPMVKCLTLGEALNYSEESLLL